ncbi:EamA domain [Dillenia turbinata]|uniref:WAT1-related protein n=1 Tax=Dillenia turbinata TaxID=194707 RepID=A0AAN8VPM3_9MAGN
MDVGAKLWEAVPFSILVLMEGCIIGLTIMAYTVMERGMSPFVFVAYTNALSSLLLLPYTFLCHRQRIEQCLFTLSLLLRLFFLGLTGVTIAQNLSFMGLKYSSPILVCGFANMIPTFTLMLTIILRTEKLDLRSSSCRIKLSGSLISFIGAAIIYFYKGPAIKNSSLESSYRFQLCKPLFLFSSSTNEHWFLGGILLAGGSLSVSISSIIQAGTLKIYPHMMTMVTFYSIIGTILCAIVSVIAERDLSAWTLKLDMELLVIVLSAIFGSIIRSTVQMWCLRLKGPAYVVKFKPFGVVFATIFGTIFFADSLHYGSILGAFIIGMGYYVVTWGQIKDDENKQYHSNKGLDSPEKVPLLHDQDDENHV